MQTPAPARTRTRDLLTAGQPTCGEHSAEASCDLLNSICSTHSTAVDDRADGAASEWMNKWMNEWRNNKGCRVVWWMVRRRCPVAWEVRGQPWIKNEVSELRWRFHIDCHTAAVALEEEKQILTLRKQHSFDRNDELIVATDRLLVD